MISENLFHCRDTKFNREEASMLATSVKHTSFWCSRPKSCSCAAMFNREKLAQRVNDIIAYQANNSEFTQFKHTKDIRRSGEVFSSTCDCVLTGWRAWSTYSNTSLNEGASESSFVQIIVILKYFEPIWYFSQEKHKITSIY